MTNSKSKGSKNERKIAKLFQDWTGYDFARTPQSGGLHWKTKNTVGDIVCTDEIHSRRFPFTVECKFHSEVDFSYLIDSTIGKSSNKLINFWYQALEEANTVGKIPLLFVRRNMMKADTHFIGLPSILFYSLILELEISHPELGTLEYIDTKGNKVVFLNSEDFFKWDYKKIYRIAKRLTKDGKQTG